jgi:hypothetical protein
VIFLQRRVLMGLPRIEYEVRSSSCAVRCGIQRPVLLARTIRKDGLRACNERHSKGFLMPVPNTDQSLVTVPLPSEKEITRVIGKS